MCERERERYASLKTQSHTAVLSHAAQQNKDTIIG